MKKATILIPCVFAGIISCQSSSTEASNNKDNTTISARQDSSVTAVRDTTHTILVKDPMHATKEPNWAAAGIDNPAALKSFLDSFKTWVNAGQQDSILAHIAFPLKKYKTAKAVESNFAAIFDQTLKEKITKQPSTAIFVNANGVMLGDGEIWMNYLKGSYYITAINK